MAFILAVSLLFLLFPVTALGQHTQRQGPSTASGTQTPAEDPALEKFKHAIAVQASEEQVAVFRRMINSAEATRQQAHQLHLQSSAGGDSIELEHKATGLLHGVDQAQSDCRDFRKSLTDSQEAELKEFTRKLTKADEAVSRAEKSVSEVLQQGPLDTAKLASAARHLESALSKYRADQVDLGKEMGIQLR